MEHAMACPVCREVDMQLQLEAPEASLLYRVVRNRLHELRVEVRHTRDSATREYLQHKERILQRILDRFPDIDERAHMSGFEAGTGRPV